MKIQDTKPTAIPKYRPEEFKHFVKMGYEINDISEVINSSSSNAFGLYRFEIEKVTSNNKIENGYNFKF